MLKNINMNPFVIKDYAGPEYFCDREVETKRIINAINNQRNLTISSIRKMGKTGLIKHVLFQLDKTQDFETIYLDIYDTYSISDFINKFGTALLQINETFSEKLIRKTNEFIKSIRPTITYDNLSGTPSFSFFIDNENTGNNTLSDLFSYLQNRSDEKKIVIAIDEFQQIANYTGSNLEATLRTNIQSLHNVQFIFSGSDKHLLSNIFTNVKRPFYQSTELMHLGEIPIHSYEDFIASKFNQEKIVFKKEVLTTILTWTRRHTYYVQYLCNKIVSTEIKQIDKDALKQIFFSVLLENEAYYFEYKNLVTPHQWKLLIAIAKDEGVIKVTASQFIRDYNLNNASTVRRGIVALLEKELVYKKHDSYYIYDVFFSRWLERR